MATATNRQTNGQHDGDEESTECPLCLEALDMDDVNFYPCVCGYQICRFCWHRIRTDENGLCPQCRKPYEENPAAFKPVSEEELQKIKGRKRGKKGVTETAATSASVNGAASAKGTANTSASGSGLERERGKKRPAVESRKAFADLRVVQKNLVFVVGLPSRLANADVLKRSELFGQFGKIVKAVVSHNTAYAGSQPSASAYITYQRPEDAMRAIWEVNNKSASIPLPSDAHKLRCSLGTTKYCSQFLKGAACNKPDCMYLHEVGDPLASFTKENMQQGMHTNYEHELLEAFKRSLASLKATAVPSGSSRGSGTALAQQSAEPSVATDTLATSTGITLTAMANASPNSTTQSQHSPASAPGASDGDRDHTDTTRSSSNSLTSNASQSNAPTTGTAGREKSRSKAKANAAASKPNATAPEAPSAATGAGAKASAHPGTSGNARRARNSGQKAGANRTAPVGASASSPNSIPSLVAADHEPLACTPDESARLDAAIANCPTHAHTQSPHPLSPAAAALDSSLVDSNVHTLLHVARPVELHGETKLHASSHEATSMATAGAINAPLGANRAPVFAWPSREAVDPSAPLLQPASGPHLDALERCTTTATSNTSVIMQQLLLAGNGMQTRSPDYSVLRENDTPVAPPNTLGSGMSLLQAIINSSRSSTEQNKRAPVAQQQPQMASYWNSPTAQPARYPLPSTGDGTEHLNPFGAPVRNGRPYDAQPNAAAGVWSSDIELRLAAASTRGVQAPPGRNGDGFPYAASDSMQFDSNSVWRSHVPAPSNDLPPTAIAYASALLAGDERMPIGSRLLNTSLFETTAPDSSSQSTARFSNFASFSNGWN